MTTLGKILIFFVLLFSVLVGYLVIMDFTARTHWAAGFEDLQKKYTVSEASNRAYQEENQKLAASAEPKWKMTP